MRDYQMQGTPTTVLIDRQGRRMSQLGLIDDIALVAAVGRLAAEDVPAALVAHRSEEAGPRAAEKAACDEHGCPVVGA